MKKAGSIGLRLAVLMVWVSACSPSVYFEKSPSVNFVRLKTFAFLPRADSTQVSVYSSAIMDELIHQTISSQLKSRGLEVDTMEPDMLVKFHLMVENKEEMVNNSAYRYPMWGYGPMRYPYYYYPGPIFNDFRTIQYKEGTLIIDIIERETGKLVWRGWSTRNIDNVNRFEAKLPDVIDQIMANYPIGPR